MVRSQSTFPFCVSIAFLLCLFCTGGCGGGGSGGGGPVTAGSGLGGDSSFYLEEIKYGRPRLDPAGNLYEIINPATLLEIDPITGLELEDPVTLFPDETIDELYWFNLGETTSSSYKVKIIPRNAAVILQFTKNIDPNSLKLNDLKLTESSPIALATDGGTAIDVDVYWGGHIGMSHRHVILNPITAENVGFPPSPLLFDQAGNPKPLEKGYLKLSVTSAGTGPNTVLSNDGKVLSARTDLYGSPLKPIGFNPGNARIDFIDYGDISFNGFLPDLSAPRIIREVKSSGSITEVLSGSSFRDSTKTFNEKANNGDGEWAGALLILRPQQDNAQLRVEQSIGDTIFLDPDSVLTSDVQPQVGDDYQLVRAELYEPIPGFDLNTDVDPENHPKDPEDPEDYLNSDLFRFVFWEQMQTDGDGKPIVDPTTGEPLWEPAEIAEGVPYDPGPQGIEPVNPNWRLSLRFSEPMALESYRPYESFFIINAAVDIEDPGFAYMLPGRPAASENNLKISFEPVVPDQFNQMVPWRHLGFGGKAKSLRLVLRVVPPTEQVYDFYKSLGSDPSTWPEEVVPDLVKEGVLGIFDLGGQPLAMPAAFLDKGNPYSVLNQDSQARGAFVPALDLKYEFNTMQISEEDNPETGVLVHRFMGLPETGVGGFPQQPGIIFNDHDDLIYGPNIADVSVGLNGYLSGRSVEFIQHVFDDYNHPPPSSPTYPDPIFKMPFGTGTPVNGSFGARFMHVYRKGDASPDVDTFEGTILHLIGLSWAPIGGWVTNTLIEKMSIGMAYSQRTPDTKQHAGIPDNGGSGLLENFNSNIMSNPVEGLPNRIMVVGSEHDGVPYLLDWRNLFVPKNQGQNSNFNDYLPWPDFTQFFPYDSSASLLIEYRMNPNVNAGVSLNNGFAFHAGIISSMMPRFRIYTRGDNGSPIGRVFAATDPNSPSYAQARGPLASPGNYGDNSRYLSVMDYAKLLSMVESPFLGAEVDEGYDAYFFNPIIDPPVSERPEGTELDIIFRSAPNPESSSSYSPWRLPAEVEDLFNAPPFNLHSYFRFKAVFEANIDSAVLPVIDTIALPYQILQD